MLGKGEYGETGDEILNLNQDSQALMPLFSKLNEVEQLRALCFVGHFIQDVIELQLKRRLSKSGVVWFWPRNYEAMFT